MKYETNEAVVVADHPDALLFALECQTDPPATKGGCAYEALFVFAFAFVLGLLAVAP